MSGIVFIGGGNMARCLIGGLIAEGTAPDTIAVAEPMAAARENLARDFGCAVYADNREAAATADTWVLAVKPQAMAEVLGELASLATARAPLAISIAAGVTRSRIAAGLPTSRVIRAMPNTPALIGAGVTGLCAGADVALDERQRCEALFASAGAVAWIDDEALMDAVTAVSGSGPAYYFLLMESMIDAGIRQGLSAEVARTLVLHTALGAARMAVSGAESPSQLRERVTSPGGTTAAALKVFADGGFRDLADAAIDAAVRRGRELS